MPPGHVPPDGRGLPEESLQPVRLLWFCRTGPELPPHLCVCEQEAVVEGRLHGDLRAGGGRRAVRGQSGRQQGELCGFYRAELQNCRVTVVPLQAVMCRTEAAAADGPQKLLTLALSKEHNPTIYEERMRIQRAGGTVRSGPLRVCGLICLSRRLTVWVSACRDGRVLGVLEVSRSIGDGQYKRCGIISTPDLRRCQLTANDRQEQRKSDWNT